jgi:NitT/TauT family transport system substrate-binding protein
MFVRARRRVLLGPLGIALAVASVGGSTSPAHAAPRAPVTIKVGLIPITDVAPVYLGIKKGFFRRQNLIVEPHLAAGGAVIIPSVVSGEYQFGFSNIVSELLAYSQGLRVQIVSPGSAGAKTAERAWSGVIVPEDSPIRSARDLQGRTISVNTLNNIGDVTIRESLRKRGANPSSPRFVEIPFPGAVQALSANRVDAAWVVEPFLTQGLVGGSRMVLANYEATSPSLPIATYFTTKQYADRNAGVVRRFRTAMRQSLNYARTHPRQARSMVLSYTRIGSGVVARMQLPSWPSTLDRKKVDLISSLMVRYGLIRSKPNLDGVLRLGQK